RSDVSDTLPGVAIAISLVPPLVTVGLLLEVHRYHDALGALLLFATNVAAIVATGVVVLLLFRVRSPAGGPSRAVRRMSGAALAVVAVVVVALCVPLARSSAQVVGDEVVQREAADVAERWAREAHWSLESVEVHAGTV